MYCDDGDAIMYNSLTDMQESVAFTYLQSGCALSKVNNFLTVRTLVLEGQYCNNTCTFALAHHTACVWKLKHVAVQWSNDCSYSEEAIRKHKHSAIERIMVVIVLGVRIIAFVWWVGGVVEIHCYAL